MKTKVIIGFSVAILLSATLLLSCETENNDQVSTEEALRAINENAKAAALFKDAFNEANDAAMHADDSLNGTIERGQYSYEDEPAISITPFDLTSWPKTIVVDYGAENMMCSDMRERRGIINIVASDFYQNPGCTLTITFEEFYQENHKIEGTKTIINQGENSEENLVYDVIVENGKITTPDNVSFYFDQNTQREWKEGSETINPWDDVYDITGSQEGISSDSVNYTLTIDDNHPLNVLIGCRWIRAGILAIDIEDIPTITLDYGAGVCDNAATVTISGNEYYINME